MSGPVAGKAARRAFDVTPDGLFPTVAAVEINLVHIHNMRCVSVRFNICLLFLAPDLFIYSKGRIDAAVAL